MSADDNVPAGSGDDPNLYPRLVARTTLLAVSVAFLFPMLLDRLTNGAWPRFVLGLGEWKWAAWGACFLGMVLMRFAGGPRRE